MLNPTFAFVGSIGKVPQEKIFTVANWLWEENYKTEIFYEQMNTKE